MSSSNEMRDDLQMLQSLARDQTVAAFEKKQIDDKKKRDVTGRWMGFNPDGTGRVEYLGKIYNAKVLAATCKQKYAKVNLRRTPLGNFVDWA